MKEILEIVFSGFWTFIGSAILLGMVIDLIRFLVNRPLRAMNIRKHGWPPPHCDGDGDFPEPEERDDDEGRPAGRPAP